MLKNIRIKNIEIRKYSNSDCPHYEIIKWVKDENNSDGTEFCYVIAFIDNLSNESFDVRLCGTRFWELKKEEREYFDKIIGAFNFILFGKFISD